MSVSKLLNRFGGQTYRLAKHTSVHYTNVLEAYFSLHIRCAELC